MMPTLIRFKQSTPHSSPRSRGGGYCSQATAHAGFEICALNPCNKTKNFSGLIILLLSRPLHHLSSFHDGPQHSTLLRDQTCLTGVSAEVRSAPIRSHGV